MQINNCQITTEFGEGSPVLFYPPPEEGQTMTIHAEVVMEVFQGGTFVETDPVIIIRALARSGRLLLEESRGINVPPGTSGQVEVTVDAGGLARPPEFELGPPWTIDVEGQARIREDDPISERIVVNSGSGDGGDELDPLVVTLQDAGAAPTENGVLQREGPDVKAGTGNQTKNLNDVGGSHWAIQPAYLSGPAHGEGDFAFRGGATAPDGRIIFAPTDSANVGIFDPSDDSYTSGPAHGEGDSAFRGGVPAPDGRVILPPNQSANVGIVAPYTVTQFPTMANL